MQIIFLIDSKKNILYDILYDTFFVIFDHFSEQSLVEVLDGILDDVDAHGDQREADHHKREEQQHVAVGNIGL
jgi:hypothetical protein